MERYSASEQETEAIGREMAQRLAPGAVVAFTGDLGAGKTAFVRGMAQGLGISQRVTSPTFTIVNEYEGGTLPLFHFDMYRLRDADDLFDIGWEDFLRRGGVCAVEWSETIQEALEEQKKGLGYVVDCTIEETELVRPMVNGGTHITEFLVN